MTPWRRFGRLAKSSTATATSTESVKDLVEEGACPPVESQGHPASPRSGVTFEVDSVTPADRPIWSETLADSLGRRFQRKVLLLPQARKPVINAVLNAGNEQTRAQNLRRSGSRCHPFIDAVHIAFSQHRPLTLTPDTIWLLIVQGFSHHIAENAESMRSQLVRHEGKKELVVTSFELNLTAFEKAIAQFSSLVREQINPVLHDTLVCDFSTTTPAIRTAGEVALMDSFSSYFTYMMVCVCGIPRITIEGTPEDWQRIRERVEVLATYGLEWWVSRLRPILDEFVLAAEGRPTQNFWQAIYKPRATYGDKVATGWITELFPYLGDAPKRLRNPVFNREVTEWTVATHHEMQNESVTFGPPHKYGISPKHFPSGLSSAQIKVSFEDGSTKVLDLVAGFLGVTQNSSDLALSPLISWCVAELPPTKPVMVF